MNLRNRCNRWTERNRCNRWIERNLRNLVLLTISCMILCGPALAWSEIPLQLPENPSQILDFMIPETGPFAGYPLLLCRIDDFTNLYWISDPVDPETIGSFLISYSGNEMYHRLTLDPAGNPILIEMSWGRCSFIKHESGCWHPRRSIPISGSEHCIGWVSAQELQIDYRMGYDLYRAIVDVNTWITESTMIAHGYYASTDNLPFWYATAELTYYPAAISLYLIANSRTDYQAHFGTWWSDTREVSLIPESHYETSGNSGNIGPGTLVADWLSDDSWVALFQFGDDPYKIKHAHSDIVALESVTAAAVDAASNDMQYAAWADTGGTLYLMTSDTTGWLPPEPIFTASSDSMALAVSGTNKWILFHEDPGWRLITENPAPATPTPNPDPPPTCTPGPETALLEIHLSRRLFHPTDDFRCELWIRNPDAQDLIAMPVFVLLEVGDTLFFGPGFGTTPDDYRSAIPLIPPDLSIHWIINAFTWPEGAGDMTGVRLIAAMTDPDVTEIVSNVDIVEFGWMSSDASASR